MEQVETFDGNEKKIYERGNSLTLREKLEYYKGVLKILYVERGAFKRDLYMEDNGLKKRLEKEIEQLEREVKSVEEEGSIVKIVSKSGVSDIVRIFEAMYDSHIIAMNTEVTQIAKIFFSEPLKTKNFADQYYARKDDIENFERNSNSKELVKFVKILIEKSFNKKELILNELTRHIEQVRKT